jgi:hypothetical protein
MLSRENLIGRWNLIEHFQIDDNLEGELIYNDDHTMLVNIKGTFKGDTLNISYNGTFELKDDYVIHKVLKSNNQKIIDTDQIRYVTLSANKLILSPNQGELGSRIVWVKKRST